jgi:hypothetical protein
MLNGVAPAAGVPNHHCSTLRRVRVAVVPIVVAAVLAVAAPASAADVSLAPADAEGVRLGDATELSGRVTDSGAPLAGRTVRLEVRPHPFDGPWEARRSAVTRADGTYAFAPRLRRNHQARARLDPLPDGSGGGLSPVVEAYVLPAFTLSFTSRGSRAIALRQVYTVPRAVRLRAPTRFYVGPCKPGSGGECTARRAPLAASARTRRVRAGRYVARARVRIPASFRGRFSYVSCFAYSKGSGMGDPDQRCPERSIRLR